MVSDKNPGRRIRIWILPSCVPEIRMRSPFLDFPEEKFEFIYAPSWKAILNLPRLPDIIVFHRNACPLFAAARMLEFARSHGITTVLDMDDLLTEMPPRHPTRSLYEAIRSELVSIMKAVDVMIVATDSLKAHYLAYNPNIYVLPNLIDERIWSRGKRSAGSGNGKITIGYSGTTSHTYDLEIVTPAIKHILSKYGDRVCFKFIGCITEELKKMPGVYHIEEANPYTKYAQVMKDCDFDFVFAVLEDNTFNRAKSNIKFLEYSICGYPGIYSRVGPYADSITHNETGLLVDNTTEDWIRAMELLINDRDLRERLGRNAYKYVKENYSLRSRGREWYERYVSIAASGGEDRCGARFSLGPYISYGPYMIHVQISKMYYAVLGLLKKPFMKG